MRQWAVHSRESSLYSRNCQTLSVPRYSRGANITGSAGSYTSGGRLFSPCRGQITLPENGNCLHLQGRQIPEPLPVHLPRPRVPVHAATSRAGPHRFCTSSAPSGDPRIEHARRGSASRASAPAPSRPIQPIIRSALLWSTASVWLHGSSARLLSFSTELKYELMASRPAASPGTAEEHAPLRPARRPPPRPWFYE